MECKRCSYVWSNRKQNPRMCPNCKSRDYLKTKGEQEALENGLSASNSQTEVKQ